MSILYHHYKELKECIKQVEQIGLDSTGAIRQDDEERRKGRRTTRFAAIISTMTTVKVNRILNQAHSALSLFKDIYVIAL
jgi:hypothetical protein